MKNSIFARRILPMVMVTLLCMALIIPGADASTQSEIDDLKDEAAAIDERKEEAPAAVGSAER